MNTSRASSKADNTRSSAVSRAAARSTTAQVLLDGNAEAAGKSYWDLGATAHSPDHKLLAYATDDKGSELYTVRIRDLATGKDLADEIPDTQRRPRMGARRQDAVLHQGR